MSIASEIDPTNIVLEYMQAVWNDRDMSAISKAFHQNACIHSTMGDLTGPQEMAALVDKWLIAFPDLAVSIQHTLLDGDMVCVMWSAQGTHQGPLGTLQATGLRANYTGVTIHRVCDGSIREYWAYVDMKSFLDKATQV